MEWYLLHQSLDGTPVGVFDRTGGSFYLPQDQQHAAYGRLVVGDRPRTIGWDEWAQRLQEKTPGMAKWSIYSHEPDSLEQVLLAAKFASDYEYV